MRVAVTVGRTITAGEVTGAQVSDPDLVSRCLLLTSCDADECRPVCDDFDHIKDVWVRVTTRQSQSQPQPLVNGS